MAERRPAPTFSIGCSDSALRMRANSLRPVSFSSMNFLAKEPSWISSSSLLHGLLGLGGDDARAGHVVAPLGGVGDGVAHVGEAAAIHEVDDELELVEDLEVGELGLIAGLGEGLEACLDQGGGAAAEDGLLAEEVGLGLLGEGGFEHAGAGAADALGVAER